MSERSRLHRAAIRYAAKRLARVPARPHGKRPINLHGLLEATTDEDLVDRWWTTRPDANIGLRTGIRFDVLDVDDDQAVVMLNERCRDGGLTPCRSPRW